ncbi:MAG: class I SAM-dependent methyltransferase, partial [Selenomonadaceae bacterium]|nr:class I SAM-dependent methyltransferase [Selenomonadaceae bacterium]
YVDKPMIFLMRSSNKMERFHELAQEILKASYLVDGKDFDGIAAMIQRVFIEGDDYKAQERKEVFDKYLNYPKTNGMLASEFIYKNISQDLECPVENHWQELWNNRKINFDELSTEDEEQLILELKRIVGWDFHDKKNSVAFDEFRKEYNYIKENLGLSGKNSGTVFEVGCGSGANLYFFKEDGFKVGGSDYAENLLAVTRRVIGEKNLIECIAGEAIDLPTEIKYDAVFAAAVLCYLPDLNYVEKVLDLMLNKARCSIGITRILNVETKDDYLKYRREHTKNYDELYKDLPKLFISKKFFEEYAAKNNLAIKFSKHHIEGFWNEPFNFDCFMYKI